jgi:[acyl-carrier-protein] S-malonyltransferase
MDPETAFRLVQQRGQLMAKAASQNGGTMAAVLGLSNELLLQLCESDPGRVVVANLNSPGQAVLSGEAEAVERVGNAAKEAGAKRVVPLAVSGAFHSPLMQAAADEMKDVLAHADLQMPEIPVYSNVTARPYQDAEEVKRLLSRQIVSGVRWEETIRNMVADGATIFVELGPGKVLSGLIRRIDDSVTVHNVEDSASLEKTLTGLKDMSEK